ncbi:MAG: NAD-dependent epimerase/dehydratase family protein [Thermoanaerobaculia bacterium]
MNVFIAGATGTIGRPVVRRLVRAGHEVTGLTRTKRGVETLTRLGAKAVIGDALDAAQIERLVVDARPTHVLHLLTAIPAQGAVRPRDLAATNILRTEGTANLLRAAIAAGAERIVAESFALAYGVGDFGSDPLPEPRLGETKHPHPGVQAIVDALRSLESQLSRASKEGQIETVVLRYGLIYGPDVPSTESMIEGLRRRRMPLIAKATGIASFVHIDDAATATVAALEHGCDGEIYNIVDDSPAAFNDFLLEMAKSAGTPQPRAVPLWLARILAPLAAEMAGARLPMSNMHAKAELSWRPRYRTPHEGLATIAARS